MFGIVRFEPDFQKGDQTTVAEALKYCVLLFLVTRILLCVTGLLAYHTLHPFFTDFSLEHEFFQASPAILDIWVSWDSYFYLSIIEPGYHTHPITSGDAAGLANWAFFPLYPNLAFALSMLTGADAALSLIIVSNLFFVGALLLAWYETVALADKKTAVLVIVLLCIMPGTHFFSSGYTESTSLFLTIATLMAARRKQFVAAAVLAGLATLTRNLGIFLTLPIAFYAWQAWQEQNGQSYNISSALRFTFSAAGLKTFVVCLIPALAIIGFMIFLAMRTGDAFAFITIQEAWRRGDMLSIPLVSLLGTTIFIATIPAYAVINLFSGWCAVFALGYLYRFANVAYIVFATVMVLIILTTGIISIYRYFLIVFPLFVAAAVYFCSIGPTSRKAIIAFLFLLGHVIMAAWASGAPVV